MINHFSKILELHSNIYRDELNEIESLNMIAIEKYTTSASLSPRAFDSPISDRRNFIFSLIILQFFIFISQSIINYLSLNYFILFYL